MKKKVYFARHGETDWNRKNRMQGRTDIPLNRTGEEQARRLADAVARLEISRIVSSPLKRAAKSAEIISGRIGVPVGYNAGIIEKSFGDAEGMRREEIFEKFHHAFVMDGEYIDWGRTVIPGGENINEHGERLAKAIAEIMAGEGDGVLIVTHGANIQQLFNGARTKNCCCYSADYDTETGALSGIECVYEGGDGARPPV